MNFASNSRQSASFLLRRLHLLVDIRKRHAFDFLASLPDMDLYGPQSRNRAFHEDDLNMSNEWETQQNDFDDFSDEPRREKPRISDNMFQDFEEEIEKETFDEQPDTGFGQMSSNGLSFGGLHGTGPLTSGTDQRESKGSFCWQY